MLVDDHSSVVGGGEVDHPRPCMEGPVVGGELGVVLVEGHDSLDDDSTPRPEPCGGTGGVDLVPVDEGGHGSGVGGATLAGVIGGVVAASLGPGPPSGERQQCGEHADRHQHHQRLVPTALMSQHHRRHGPSLARDRGAPVAAP